MPISTGHDISRNEYIQLTPKLTICIYHVTMQRELFFKLFTRTLSFGIVKARLYLDRINVCKLSFFCLKNLENCLLVHSRYLEIPKAREKCSTSF